MRQAYHFKLNSRIEKQLILSLVMDGKIWHYVPVTRLLLLLRVEHSKHNWAFPNEDKENTKRYQGLKSLKILFTIYFGF